MEWARRRLGGAAVILNGNGHVLLVRHTYGRLNWEIPGGASEPGESVLETVVREVREETGLNVSPERLTGFYYEPSVDAHHVVFRCHVTDDSVPRPPSDEISTCEYWPPDALPRPISLRRLPRPEARTIAVAKMRV